MAKCFVCHQEILEADLMFLGTEHGNKEMHRACKGSISESIYKPHITTPVVTTLDIKLPTRMPIRKLTLDPEVRLKMEARKAKEARKLEKEAKKQLRLERKIEKKEKMIAKEDKEGAIEKLLVEFEKRPTALYAISKEIGISYASARYQLLKRGLLKERSKNTGDVPIVATAVVLPTSIV